MLLNNITPDNETMEQDKTADFQWGKTADLKETRPPTFNNETKRPIL